MKKNVSMFLIAAVVLLVAALVMKSTVGLGSKQTNGGCAVRIEVGSTYDEAAVPRYLEGAGFVRPVVLETGRTVIELETGAMAQEKLENSAQKLLAAVQAEYPAAVLAYAESFEAAQGERRFGDMLPVLLGLVVLLVVGYLYGALRFGWCKGAVPALCAFVVAVVTGSLSVLLSAVFAVSAATTALVGASAVLSYVLSVVVCGRLKADPEYSVGIADLQTPVLLVIASAYLAVTFGLGSSMPVAIISVVVMLAGMCSLTPGLWKTLAK
ncbi:MAG: hypothetical protein Q4A66_06795 [Eubacteriales bacterium]|nr:hypothetical protein [Eubacteriales bacterium]